MESFTWVDQLMFGMHAKIERLGWTGMYVFGEHETQAPPWGYTIGLAERAFHPELVIVGLGDCCVAELFDVLATRVTAGERLDDLPEGRVTVEGHPYRVVPVRSSHWATDRFSMWLEYYGCLGAGVASCRSVSIGRHDDGHAIGGTELRSGVRTSVRSACGAGKLTSWRTRSRFGGLGSTTSRTSTSSCRATA